MDPVRNLCSMQEARVALLPAICKRLAKAMQEFRAKEGKLPCAQTSLSTPLRAAGAALKVVTFVLASSMRLRALTAQSSGIQKRELVKRQLLLFEEFLGIPGCSEAVCHRNWRAGEGSRHPRGNIVTKLCITVKSKNVVHGSTELLHAKLQVLNRKVWMGIGSLVVKT